MKVEDVLLPNAPLFLVHRGWNSRQQQRTAIAEVSRGDDNGNVKIIGRCLKQNISSSSSSVSGEKTGKLSIGQRAKGPDTTKRFEFVNTIQPKRLVDPKVRTLVMRHVKTGVKRSPNVLRTSSSKLKTKLPTNCSSPGTCTNAITESKSCSSNNEIRISLNSHTSVSGASMPFYGNIPFSLPTGPRVQLLLSYYLHELATLWYPLDAYLAYNPVREGWFRLAITNETLFRAILFCSASNLGRKSGNRNFEEVASLASSIILHLNQLLKANSMPTDTTISIVSCLAMAELSSGNLENWKLHMAAIRAMVLQRGGIDNVCATLQIKITRADIEGSSEIVALPNLLPPQRSTPKISTSLPDSTYSSLYSDNDHYQGLSCEMQSIFQDLFRLNLALCHAISSGEAAVDPHQLDDGLIHIHHELLQLLAPNSLSHSLSYGIGNFTLIGDLNEAIAIVALLFAKSLSRGTGSIASGTRPITRRLLTLLFRIHKYLTAGGSKDLDSHTYYPAGDANFLSPRLLVWLFFMGGIAAQGSEAQFFEESLLCCLDICTSYNWCIDGAFDTWNILPSWKDIKEILGRVLWFPLFYDDPGERLWELVVKRSEVTSTSPQLQLTSIYPE